jgi:hypothetical protein
MKILIKKSQIIIINLKENNNNNLTKRLTIIIRYLTIMELMIPIFILPKFLLINQILVIKIKIINLNNNLTFNFNPNLFNHNMKIKAIKKKFFNNRIIFKKVYL